MLYSVVEHARIDGNHPERDVAGAVCINEQGCYQLLLAPGGGENPPLFTKDGIPLYRWDGERAVLRTGEELAAERAAEIRAVTYGGALPDDLAEHMAAILASAGGGADA